MNLLAGIEEEGGASKDPTSVARARARTQVHKCATTQVRMCMCAKQISKHDLWGTLYICMGIDLGYVATDIGIVLVLVLVRIVVDVATCTSIRVDVGTGIGDGIGSISQHLASGSI